jgi:hypothetical protein
LVQVEHQNVLAAAGDHMQPGTQRFQEAFVAAQFARFTLGDQAACFEFAPATTETGRLGNPQNQLQIAQAARAFLDVRLERIRRVLKLGVPLTHFQHFGLEERVWVERFAVAPRKVVEERGAARNAPRFEQRGAHGDVVGGFFDALHHAAHAATEFEPQIPREADKALDARFEMLNRRVGQQDQNVDVRVRCEFAPPVAADSQQRQFGRQLAAVPRGAQRLVCGARERGHQRVDVGGGLEAFQQLGFGHFIVRLERRGMGLGDGWNTTHWQAGR